MAVKCDAHFIYDDEALFGVALSCDDINYFGLKVNDLHPEIKDCSSFSEMSDYANNNGMRIVTERYFVTRLNYFLTQLFDSLVVT